MNTRSKIPKILAVLLALIIMTGLMAQTGFSIGINSVVDGRILTPEMTGDTVNWVEIAKDGNYSLIVRSSFININQNTVVAGKSIVNDPYYQYTRYGATDVYSNSNVRNYINAWFNGTAAGSAEKLPAGARIRSFAMANNALTKIGTTCNPNVSLTDGLSEASSNQQSSGNDVAFALSYSESANFLSKMYFMRNTYIANVPSSAAAVANFKKINLPPENLGYYFMWLRSVGDIKPTVGCLHSDAGNITGGRTFQMYVDKPEFRDNSGLVYPAMWVGQGIFLPAGKTVTGKVWPIMDVDSLGLGSTFMRKHDVAVELRPTFLTPAPANLRTTAVSTGVSGQGEFTLTNVPNGNYVLYIKRPGYLARAMPVSITDASPAVVTLAPPGTTDGGIFNLWWGDCNDDWRIDNDDELMILELLSMNVNAASPYYNAACDLNGDALIDNEDILMVLEMWDRNTTQYPGFDGVNPFE